MICQSASGTRNSGIAEERSNNLHISLQEPYCLQFFSERKERWAVSTSSKFEIIELVSFISSIQDGRPQTGIGITKKGDFMMKLDLQDASLSVSLHRESRKNVRFQ